ncbi:MAG: hypothetical protein ACRDNY_05055 [Gaiellaceae bacterium]
MEPRTRIVRHDSGLGSRQLVVATLDSALRGLVHGYGATRSRRHGAACCGKKSPPSTKAAGAVGRDEPTEKPYGTMQYAVADPEGHLWLFSEHIRDPDPKWRIYSSTG